MELFAKNRVTSSFIDVEQGFEYTFFLSPETPMQVQRKRKRDAERKKKLKRKRKTSKNPIHHQIYFKATSMMNAKEKEDTIIKYKILSDKNKNFNKI